MTTIAERHRSFAAAFGSVIDAVTDWDAPTPVPEWRAHDVVEHLLTWPVPLLRDWAGIELADEPGADLAARWSARTRRIEEVLTARDHARPLGEGHFAGQPLDDVVDRIYTGDVFLHTWDLAASAHVTPPMDERFAAHMLEGMRAIEDVLRGSGQYGPARTTSRDDAVSRLMAFVGRDVDRWPLR